MKHSSKQWKALKTAFPYTIPIMTGFLFLGFAYGFLMRKSGFSPLYPMIMSIVIYGGSLEFVAVSMLLGSFAPLQTLMVTLIIQARHLFYGVSMLSKYRGLGWKRFFLIFGMSDETFSINCSTDVPEGVDRGWFYLCVTFLNELYWFTGATSGALLGGVINFNTEGLDFVMTAMFVVIFIEQWKKEKQHLSAYVGLGATTLCLVLIGAENFLIPAMIVILVLLTVLRRPISKKMDDGDVTERKEEAK